MPFTDSTNAFNNRIDGVRTHSFVDAAPAGDVDAGDVTLIEDSVGIAYKDQDATEDVAFIYSSRNYLFPCQSASGSNFEEGSAVYLDPDTLKASATSSNGAFRFLGTVLVQPASSAASLEIDFAGGAGILQDQTGVARVLSTTATVTELNAGKVLIAGVTGMALTIHGYRFMFHGIAAGATTLDFEDTATSPVAVVKVAVAAAADTDIVGSYGPLDTGVTSGAGFDTPLGDDEGLQVTVTGSTLTGTTSADIQFTYSWSAT